MICRDQSVWAMAFAALVGGLIPLLLQLRKPVAESRGVSRACGGLLYAAGAVGDTMHGSMSRYGAGAGLCWSLWPAWRHGSEPRDGGIVRRWKDSQWKRRTLNGR